MLRHEVCLGAIKADDFHGSQEMRHAKVVRKTRNLRGGDIPWSNMIQEEEPFDHINLLIQKAIDVRLRSVISIPQHQLGCHSKFAACTPW